MGPAQMARLLPLVAFGCIVQLMIVQPATPDPVSPGGAEGRRMGENPVRDDEASILAVLRGVEAAFSDTDLPRYLTFFYSPYLIMAPAGVIAPSSEDEALALLRPQVDSLRARGYARSELNQAKVKLLSATTALASVEWTRFKAKDEELERLGATYAFFKGESGWKIVMVSVYPPTTLAEPR